MAINIGVDTQPLISTINNMIAQIDHFKRVDIGMVLSEFQIEDMHRNRPFTMRSRAKGQAVTKVRPHSLFEMERSVRAAKAYRRARVRAFMRTAEGKRTRRMRTREYQHWSTRPILREEMYGRLEERLVQRRNEKLVWKTAKIQPNL